MKAIQFARFGGAEVLEYVDIDRPVPKADQILIEVSASAVNFPDIRERSGIYQRAETHVGGVMLPHVTGLQAVGRVVQTGTDADTRLLGCKVVALLPEKGGYAQYVAAPEALAVVLPEEKRKTISSHRCLARVSQRTLRSTHQPRSSRVKQCWFRVRQEESEASRSR